jgi:hypothetical protein
MRWLNFIANQEYLCDPGRKQLVDICRKTLARNPADPRRQHLDANHQWRSEQQRPHQTKTELRTGLRIGGDATGVIVGGASNQARSESRNEISCNLSDHCNTPDAKPWQRIN